jgi:MFS superfamily sulfate permease-like transporter
MAATYSSVPSGISKYFLKKNLKRDLPSSVVVFLVALPLCLGIALASGAPLFAGVLTGIIGGIIVSSASGSQLSVSGPAAGLTVIVFGAIAQLGAYPTFLLAVFIAGIIQIVLGFIKAGTIANYFPSSVIEGMLAAIGIILILKQIPHAVGYDSEYEGNESFIGAGSENTFSLIGSALGAISYGAVIISAISILILIYWPKIKKVSSIPAALIVVVAGILLNTIFEGSSLAIKDEHLVRIPVIGSFEEFKDLLIFPDFSQIANKEVGIVEVTIAIVASIETLGAFGTRHRKYDQRAFGRLTNDCSDCAFICKCECRRQNQNELYISWPMAIGSLADHTSNN